MDRTKLRKAIVKSEYTRKYPDPLNENFSGDPHNIEHHILVSRAIDVPSGIPEDPNPRTQRRNKDGYLVDYGVYMDVRKSLEDDNDLSFHLKNKGITILAQKVDYSQDKRVATIHMGEGDGIADGAHTYQIILESKGKETCPEGQYVKFEVITGVTGEMRTAIAGGLNTAVQVQPASLANLGGRFEWVKEVLEGEPYADKIAYEQNERAPYDIREIVGILTLFNVKAKEFSDTNHPVVAYTSKAKCLEMYLNDEDKEKGKRYFRMLAPILKDILYLYEYVQTRAPERYIEEVPGSKPRAWTTVFTKPRKSQFHFMGEETETKRHLMFDGSLYPMLASLRFLVEQKPGENVYSWKLKSFEEIKKFFDEVATVMLKTTYNCGQIYKKPNPVGKDQNHWDNLYKTVALRYLTRSSK